MSPGVQAFGAASCMSAIWIQGVLALFTSRGVLPHLWPVPGEGSPKRWLWPSRKTGSRRVPTCRASNGATHHVHGNYLAGQENLQAGSGTTDAWECPRALLFASRGRSPLWSEWIGRAFDWGGEGWAQVEPPRAPSICAGCFSLTLLVGCITPLIQKNWTV